ncbi:MAG: T9SS type A sorting domain-containing protein [Flavobacteriales bacterium]
MRFKFSSSDNGAFGMNTPAYACIDNILFEEYFSLDEETQSAFNLYPNPANTQLNVQLNQQDVEVKQAIITDVLGRTIAKYDLKSSEALSFDVSSLEKGQYFLILKNETEQFSQAFTKL